MKISNTEEKLSQNKEDPLLRVPQQNQEIEDSLNRRKYLLTVCRTGYVGVEPEQQDGPRRYYKSNCSLIDIEKIIEQMRNRHWIHPDIGKVPMKDIPYEEKKWFIVDDLLIEPMTEELEKDYLERSKNGFFETWRLIGDEDD